MGMWACVKISKFSFALGKVLFKGGNKFSFGGTKRLPRSWKQKSVLRKWYKNCKSGWGRCFMRVLERWFVTEQISVLTEVTVSGFILNNLHSVLKLPISHCIKSSFSELKCSWRTPVRSSLDWKCKLCFCYKSFDGKFLFAYQKTLPQVPIPLGVRRAVTAGCWGAEASSCSCASALSALLKDLLSLKQLFGRHLFYWFLLQTVLICIGSICNFSFGWT